MSRLAAISVDLDSLTHYCGIHGLPVDLLDERARGLVASTAIPRFLELFDVVGAPATFFVVGGELGAPALVSALKRAHGAGVELASHSFSHDYRLSRASPAAIADDLARAEQVMVEHLGVRPVGFRAPGYTLSPALLQAVEARGYRYDSSTYPAAPYYAAKALVMGALSVAGRPSAALLDSPSVLGAPRIPYRPDLAAPYRRGSAKLIELPMAVTPVARVPFIGTFATSLPWLLVEQTFRRFRGDELFNFELHAIDVLDASDGVPAQLVARQRDLRVPVREKLQRLRRLFAWLGDDRERLTVAGVAERLAPTLR
ncbi:MAG: polysaccharide deacetylase family protein [Archangium sp.]|nr:polysaccharide deacetylase family protein [Archangium sp.]